MRTSVENEWLCSKVLHAFGLPIARCDIAHFEDMKALVVARFDRRRSDDGSWIVRLPQEDFCQATGTAPHLKYQAHGGPGITTIMGILLGSEEAELDRRRFFKTQLVFWLLAATDGHAKNFSIFHRANNRFKSTPLYDVLSAHPIIGTGANHLALQNAKLAMAVRGAHNHYVLAEIRRRHWASHAGATGLGGAAAEQIIAEVLSQVGDVIDAVGNEIPNGFPMDLANAIFNGLERQCTHLARMPPGS